METVENKFVFIPFLDEIGNDLGRFDSNDLRRLMQKALDTPECVGFNTLGFLKSKITNLQPSMYFGEHDGIYILRDECRHGQTKVNPGYVDSIKVSSLEKLQKRIDNIYIPKNLVSNKTQINLDSNPHFLKKLFEEDSKTTNPIFLAIDPTSIYSVKAIPSLGFIETIVLTPSTFFAVECSSLKQKDNINITAIVYTEFDFSEKLEKLLDSKIEGVTFLIDLQNVEQTTDVIKKINHPDNAIIIPDISSLHTDSIKRLEQMLGSLHTNAHTYFFETNYVSYNAEK